MGADARGWVIGCGQALLAWVQMLEAGLQGMDKSVQPGLARKHADVRVSAVASVMFLGNAGLEPEGCLGRHQSRPRQTGDTEAETTQPDLTQCKANEEKKSPVFSTNPP